MFDRNFSLLIFVIKNLYDIRALSPSDSGQCDFWEKGCDCFNCIMIGKYGCKH
jgi:hypothetical protein